MYIILRNKKDIYFWKELYKNCNIEELYLLNSNSIIFKILRKIHISILGKWKKNIKKYDKFIIFESLYDKRVSKEIKKNNAQCKIIVYFWNFIDQYNKDILKDTNVDEFWTFDRQDSRKYKLKYNPQFYTKAVKIKNHKNKTNDIVFLGRTKDRKNEIIEINNRMKEKGLVTNFKIIENEKDFVPYDKYLEMLSDTKCILDYNQKGQCGLTLRPMEALFLEKKLITNNKDIINYDFYKPNNIFVLGIDDMDKIKEFIDSPYEEIDEEIINYYDFESWLNRFFE